MKYTEKRGLEHSLRRTTAKQFNLLYKIAKEGRGRIRPTGRGEGTVISSLVRNLLIQPVPGSYKFVIKDNKLSGSRSREYELVRGEDKELIIKLFEESNI